MKKVLITTLDQGHKSIADAVNDILLPNYEVIQTPVDLFKKFTGSYTNLYKFMPQAMAIPFYLFEKEPLFSMTKKGLAKHIYPYIKNEIDKLKPDLLISTYWGFNDVLGELSQQKHIPFINIVHDPRKPYIGDFSAEAVNCVFDKKLISYAQKYIPKAKFSITGWFTQSKYYQRYAEGGNFYNKFDFDKNTFTLLICGGSEGMTAIVKILPFLISPPKPIQIIFICGNNRPLYKLLKSIQKTLNDLPIKLRPKTKMAIIGFTRQLPQLIQISDLVMGKAGPNLIFETVACSKPFFAISHMPGQEEPNLDLILEKNIGLVEENPYKAGKIIKTIIEKPEILKSYEPSIRKMREYNFKAGENLLKLIRKLVA